MNRYICLILFGINGSVLAQELTLSENNENSMENIVPNEYYLNEEISIEEKLHLSIIRRDIEEIKRLFLVYKNSNDVDSILFKYAQAIIYEFDGETKLAINNYREILSENPNLTPIRFELAKILFEDKQYVSSKEQFLKVKSDSPPDFVMKVSDLYLSELIRKSQWQFDFYLNYIHDDNINNATNVVVIENTPFMKNDDMLPKSDLGISYGFNLKNEFNIKDNHYFYLENETFGKEYLNYNDYDDMINKTNVGYIYQDESNRLLFTPFYEQRWYSKETFRNSMGVGLEYSHWFSPHWKLMSSMEYTSNNYKKNKSLKGNSSIISINSLWLRNAKQNFLMGFNFIKDDVQVKHHASEAYMVQLIWNQEWWKGISSRLNLSAGKREFKAKAIIGDIIPLDKIRLDNEYHIGMAIWKRDWHKWGITPKINFSWKQVDSNISSMYSTKKNQIFLTLEKTF